MDKKTIAWTYKELKRADYPFVVVDGDGEAVAWTREKGNAERIVKSANDLRDLIRGASFLYHTADR